MKKLILLFLSTLFVFSLEVTSIYANINLVVSPFKYELEADRGETITRTAKIINKSNETVELTISKADFVSDNSTGKPLFVKDASGNQATANTELANWISYDITPFTIGPLESKEISFDITVPQNASPGGHYGAVFFTYNGNSGQVKVQAEYGVILLVQVAGKIKDNTSASGTIISSPISNEYEQYLTNIQNNTDSCILDMTGSNVDQKCIDEITEIQEEITNIYQKITGKIDENTPSTIKETNTEEDTEKIINTNKIPFEITFPFENTGNTHSQPKGKVYIRDENNEIIKNVGKEYIYDSTGNIIGEKIVDYIPVNQEGGNILPGTKRNFTVKAEGIFSPTNNPDEFTIETFGEYFSHLESEKKNILAPWEKYIEEQKFKTLKTESKIGYTNIENEDISFNSTSDFTVPYTTRAVALNYYFLIFSILLLITLWGFFKILWWVLFQRKKKRKCFFCGYLLQKEMAICPSCGKKLIENGKTTT